MTKPGDELLFLALGGSGEIGMNVNLYGCRGKWIMADLGVSFADANYPGIDVVLPDLAFIEERADDLLGLVITHGHEDHIGAIPYLALDLGVPIYATAFTAGLIREKLSEEGLADRVKVKIVKVGETLKLGDFTVEWVPLAHSIPEMNALLIGTPFGKIFHTGDWKLDDKPVIGEPASADALKKIGKDGLLALLGDSTNVFNEQPSGSESSVKADLERFVGEADRRVLITTFASNAARLQTLGQVAVATGRQVCVAGRSLDRIIRIAKAAGYLLDFPPTVDFDAAMRLPPKELMIIATGGQGEARAALSRIAHDSHKLKLTEGDTVLFSSKQIPGNEEAIGIVQNALAGRNIRMVTERQAHIHVSGHPGRPEIEQLYGWLKPEIVIPVHGERRHMAEHARFAASIGVPRTLVQSNGDMVRLAPEGPKIVGRERTGRLVLDGDVILAANGTTMNDRRKIAANGLVSVAVALDKGNRAKGRPQVALQGIPVEEDREDFLEETAEAVLDALEGAPRDEAKLRETVRLAVRRRATQWTGKKPVVDVMLVRV
ncbi:ribonuclease J [Sphingomonas sp. CGMCC 1.13654]|uniref:Ribonuclease J n=1 Tax=Sphingomonas chungangi TaxID=2683589 RepID=A0A838L9C3_9SPHN|nr:ribonuclease J [Sphingomonas chungangi]MBA2935784.1 ribonuclease J [Sphingomonas chungangi]MVW54475.1 RNase J family beta-CASP ribonuclease [Sphingomonas chungangi]